MRKEEFVQSVVKRHLRNKNRNTVPFIGSFSSPPHKDSKEFFFGSFVEALLYAAGFDQHTRRQMSTRETFTNTPLRRSIQKLI